MPEGPEVKGKTEWLNKRIKNKKLVNIKILSGRYKRHKDPINWDKLKKLLPLISEEILNIGDDLLFNNNKIGKVLIIMIWNGLKFTFSKSL